MSKKVLLVLAHPEPQSLNKQLFTVSKETLEAQGHEVMVSDLCAMNWKAVFDEHDFPHRLNPERLSFIRESGHAYSNGKQTPDVQLEQEKLLSADAVIFQFPLWWFSVPAILKGWFDRNFAYGLAYGYKNAGNQYRYGEGGLQGKRAMLSVTIGGPEIDYSERGINGPLEQLLFPITHGTLFFSGMQVLPTFALYESEHVTAEIVERTKAELKARVENLFIDQPIPFRSQNGGDYPDRHVLAAHVAPGMTGIDAHVAKSLSDQSKAA